MRKPLHLLLSFSAAALCVACVVSVCRPMRFRSEVKTREAEVKRRLLSVRTAEERYMREHGVYTDSWQVLTDSFGLDAENQWIPYSGGVRFNLAVSADVSLSGETLPLMECSATYDTYLKGLDAEEVKRYIRQAEMQGRFPGLKIGDITKPNNNASNWQ